MARVPRLAAALLLGVLLAACGSSSGLSPAARQRLDGQVLGWGPYLYRLSATVVPSAELGKKLGTAVYHGRVAAGLATANAWMATYGHMR